MEGAVACLAAKRVDALFARCKRPADAAQRVERAGGSGNGAGTAAVGSGSTRQAVSRSPRLAGPGFCV